MLKNTKKNINEHNLKYNKTINQWYSFHKYSCPGDCKFYRVETDSVNSKARSHVLLRITCMLSVDRSAHTSNCMAVSKYFMLF